MVGYRPVDTLVIVDAIGDKAMDLSVNLRHKRWHVQGVLFVAFAHCGGDDPAIAIDADVQFLPTPAFLLAVFVAVPCALPADLQACAVDDHVKRPLRLLMIASADLACGIAPGEGRMIGARKRQAHQRQDRVQETFRLAQRQVKEQTQRQRGFDGDVGVSRLRAALPVRRGCPGVDGLVTDPQRDVASVA